MKELSEFSKILDQEYVLFKSYKDKSVLIEIYDDKEKEELFFHNLNIFIKNMKSDSKTYRRSDLGIRSFFLNLKTI